MSRTWESVTVRVDVSVPDNDQAKAEAVSIVKDALMSDERIKYAVHKVDSILISR